jgi:hypothetical protein
MFIALIYIVLIFVLFVIIFLYARYYL